MFLDKNENTILILEFIFLLDRYSDENCQKPLKFTFFVLMSVVVKMDIENGNYVVNGSNPVLIYQMIL